MTTQSSTTIHLPVTYAHVLCIARSAVAAAAVVRADGAPRGASFGQKTA
eukprot:COSAG06_NODE_34979_length_466_cov_1.198910_1_plen_48_part_10